MREIHNSLCAKATSDKGIHQETGEESLKPALRTRKKEADEKFRKNIGHALALDYFVGFLEVLGKHTVQRGEQHEKTAAMNVPSLHYRCVRHPGCKDCTLCPTFSRRGGPSTNHLTCTAQTKAIVERLLAAAEGGEKCWVAMRLWCWDIDTSKQAAESLKQRLDELIARLIDNSGHRIKVVHVQTASMRIKEFAENVDTAAVLYIITGHDMADAMFPPQIRVWDLRARNEGDGRRNRKTLIRDMSPCFSCTSTDKAPTILLNKSDVEDRLLAADQGQPEDSHHRRGMKLQPDVVLQGSMGGRVARFRVMAEALRMLKTSVRENNAADRREQLNQRLEEHPHECRLCVVEHFMGVPLQVQQARKHCDECNLDFCDEHARKMHKHM